MKECGDPFPGTSQMTPFGILYSALEFTKHYIMTFGLHSKTTFKEGGTYIEVMEIQVQMTCPELHSW